MPVTPESALRAAQANVLAFDYGTRLIGVAIGNRMAGSARALATLRNGDWARLEAIVAEWQPGRLVVGLPLALDGAEQAMTRAARDFARELERRFALAVDLVDERDTSGEAARRFATQRMRGMARRKDANALDALAATLILERWFGATAASPERHAP